MNDLAISARSEADEFVPNLYRPVRRTLTTHKAAWFEIQLQLAAESWTNRSAHCDREAPEL
jgi:hypothetical protein